jgi:thioesterase domain-containing protein
MNRGTGVARVVQFKPGPPGPAFVLVPGTGGEVDGFADLGGALRTPMPVFAIEARGIQPGSTPDTSVEDMAEHYLACLQALQVTGPYFLAGHSFGGLVVFDMAHRLLKAQEEVACLIMLDTPVSENFLPLSLFVKEIGKRLKRHTKRLLSISARENAAYYFQRAKLRRAGLERIPPAVTMGSNIASVMIASEIARKKYDPQFYPGKLTFFRSAEAADFELAWRGRAREIELHGTAGGHIDMIEQPYVWSLADDILACLMNAAAPGSEPASGPLVATR